MQTIHATEKTGSDGTLTLRLPLGLPETEYDIVVVAQPKMPARCSLPLGYFDLLGSVDDDTFIVHPQPPLPPPVGFE
jgi:hypothetical protein